MLQGDEQSLSILLSDYHNYLVVVGTRYLKDRQRVEDVIQDLFADLWNSNKDISITAGVKSFLRGAVVNKCLAIIRMVILCLWFIVLYFVYSYNLSMVYSFTLSLFHSYSLSFFHSYTLTIVL